MFSTLFVVLAQIAVVPAIFVLILSLSSEASINARGYSFFPQEWSLYTYRYLWNQIDLLGRALMSSLALSQGSCSLASVEASNFDAHLAGQ